MNEKTDPYGEMAINLIVELRKFIGLDYDLPFDRPGSEKHLAFALKQVLTRQETSEPVLVDCEYCQGKHEKGQVEYCPLNPLNNPPQSISGIFTVEEIASFDQAYFDKLLTGFSGIRRRDLLYGSWVSSREKPAISITNNLRTRVNEHGDLVIILEMHGDRMQETLAPGQVVNLFLNWVQSVNDDIRLYAWERLNKEGNNQGLPW